MKQEKDKKTLGWLNAVARGKRRYIAALLVLQSFLGLSMVGYAIFLREIVDCAVAGNAAGLKQYCVLLIGLVLIQGGLRGLYRYLEENTRATVENRLKSRLFQALLSREYAAVTAVHSGEWMNRISSDAVVVADSVIQIIPGLGGTAIRMGAALVALVALEPGFGGIFLVCGGCLILLTVGLRRKLKQLHSQTQAADGSLRILLSERLGSLMTIRAFGKEKLTLQQAEVSMEQHKTVRMKKSGFSNLCNTGLSLAMNGASALGAIYCGIRILAGLMSYGTFTAVMQLIGQAQSPLTNISGFLPRYYAMLASAERLMEVESFREDMTGEQIQDAEDFYRSSFHALELRNASFAYQREENAPEVLRSLNLRIGKGEYVAFTGPSGCGKSTVLKLLMSLYPLDGGERVIVSDRREMPLTAAWRGLFAYVPQGNQLMNGTIREVVTFGDQAAMAREDDIYSALRIACAESFVRELPDGLDTMLGERGAGLSEGQMQRIAVARAIFSDRPILLLDEATSALDEDTEKALLTNLRNMTQRSVIIVTHRPAVLAVTDKEIKFSPAGITGDGCKA